MLLLPIQPVQPILPSSSAGEVTPSIDRNRLPSHPARAIRSQKQDHPDDVIGLAGAAEGMGGLRAVQKRFVLRIVHP